MKLYNYFLLIPFFCNVYGEKAYIQLKNTSKYQQKLTFSIIGLPRSGTTIVCSFFNSFENSFCLCEPILYYLQKKNIELSRVTSKELNLTLTDPNYFFSELRSYLNEHANIVCAGIKETYSVHESALVLLGSNFTIKIFIFRNPLALFSSYKKHRKNSVCADLNWFVNHYKKYVALFEITKDAHSIIYEQFSKNPFSYINSIMNSRFSIRGNCALQTLQGVYFGDPEAKQSTQVRPAHMDTSLLTAEERDTITKELLPLYEQLVDQEKAAEMSIF